MAATRWGIVTTGSISSDFVSALKMLPESEHKVVAVASRSLGNAKAFAEKFGIANAYGSYKELADDPDVDVAYIASVNSQHAPLSKLMLSANKHVLCEKPFCINTTEAEEVQALAKQKNRFLMEGLFSRCLPAYKRVKEELDKGSIGNPQIVSISFGFPFPAEKLAGLTNPSTGGGVLSVIGCYTLQFAQLVFGDKPEKISTQGLLNSAGTENSCVMTLTYPGDRLAVLASSLTTLAHNKAYIQGTQGIIEVPEFWAPSEVIVKGERSEYPLPDCDFKLSLPHSRAFVYEAQHVRECLLNGLQESPLVTHAQTLEISRIMDEARKQMGIVFKSGT